MRASDRALIRRIEFSIAAYTAAAALMGWRWHSGRFALGIAGGGAITYLNFLVVAGLAGKILQAQKKRYWLLYGVKSLALLGAVVGLIYFKLVDGLPLLVGLLSLFAAVAAGAVIYLVEDRRTGVHRSGPED